MEGVSAGLVGREGVRHAQGEVLGRERGGPKGAESGALKRRVDKLMGLEFGS